MLSHGRECRRRQSGKLLVASTGPVLECAFCDPIVPADKRGRCSIAHDAISRLWYSACRSCLSSTRTRAVAGCPMISSRSAVKHYMAQRIARGRVGVLHCKAAAAAAGGGSSDDEALVSTGDDVCWMYPCRCSLIVGCSVFVTLGTANAMHLNYSFFASGHNAKHWGVCGGEFQARILIAGSLLEVPPASHHPWHRPWNHDGCHSRSDGQPGGDFSMTTSTVIVLNRGFMCPRVPHPIHPSPPLCTAFQQTCWDA